MDRTIKEKVLDIIKKIGNDRISISRIPYTYHHDFLRTNFYIGKSRSDIAEMKSYSEEELYLFCLFFILQHEIEALDIIYSELNKDDFEIIKNLYDEYKKLFHQYGDEILKECGSLISNEKIIYNSEDNNFPF